MLAVNIQHRHNLTAAPYGHNYLTTRQAAARNMTWEKFHIGHDLRSLTLPRRTAHATTILYTATRQIALKWRQHQLLTHNAIEACPPEMKRGVYHRRHIRHIGNHITLALHQCLNLTIEHLIFLLLASLGNNQLLCHCATFSPLRPLAPPEFSLSCAGYNFRYPPSASDTTDKRYSSHYQAIRHASSAAYSHSCSSHF